MNSLPLKQMTEDELEEMMRLLEELRLRLRSNDAGRLLMK